MCPKCYYKVANSGILVIERRWGRVNEQVQGQTKKRILVVEDEENLLNIYTNILREKGYEVDQAKDGMEAYRKMSEGGYDLVLLDLLLPYLDGASVLKKLRDEQHPKKPNKAIVVLTNLDTQSVIADCVELGARGYMIKSGNTPDEILKHVKTYLEE